MKRKSAFVLTEVLVSLTILSLSLAPLFWTVHYTLRQYVTCIAQLQGAEIADEMLARGLTEFSFQQYTFQDALEIQETDLEVEQPSGNSFTIKKIISPLQTNKEKELDPSPQSLRVLITIEVYFSDSLLAKRSAQVCLKKGSA
jgi:hypothetical protein